MADRAARGPVLDHMRRVILAQFLFRRRIPDPIPLSLPTSTGTRRGAKSIARSLTIYQLAVPAVGRPAFSHYDFPHLEDFSCLIGNPMLFSRMFGLNLRRLELGRCTPSSSHDHLLGLLGRLTQLEELMLRYAFCDDALPTDGTAAATHPLVPVSLPQLRILDVRDEPPHASVAVLGQLISPASTSVFLRFLNVSDTSYVRTAETFFSYFKSLNTMLCATPQPQSVSISRRHDTDLELHFWGDRLTIDELRDKRVTGQSACFTFCSPDANVGFIAGLLTLVPLSNVKTALLIDPAVSGFLC